MDWQDHDWVEVPAGFAFLGSDDSDPYASDNEKPLRRVYLKRFWISKHPTTNAQLATFFRDAGERPPSGWRHEVEGRSTLARFPAVYVSWDIATAYCVWLSRRIGRAVALPTEAEWEKAARGTDGRIWPWGNRFDASVCCGLERGLGFCAVDELADGASPYGVMHLSGGVWEWCADYHRASHLNVDMIGPLDRSPALKRVVKGGSAHCTKEIVRPACRDWTNSVNQGGGDDGMRVVVRDE
jgi:serine/threonine-protein kinase